MVLKAAIELGLVIGDVGGEIGVAAVRLHQRPVDVVAEIGRAEQRLLAILPVLDRRALRRRQPALIDLALVAQLLDGRGDLIDGAFGSTLARHWPAEGKQIVELAAPSISERSEKKTSCTTLSAARSLRITAIIMSIGPLAHDRQPLALPAIVQQVVAVVGGELGADTA